MSLMRITAIILAGLVVTPVSPANEAYHAGTALALGVQSQGESALNGFKPAEVLPGFNPHPPQAGYYGGVAMPAPDLSAPGKKALLDSDSGQAVRDSLLSNPKEKIFTEAPFIQAGLAAKAQAEKLMTGQQDCQPHQVTHTTFTRHVCERDTFSLHDCSRTAEVVLQEQTVMADREESGHGTLPMTYYVRNAGTIRQVRFTIKQIPKMNGVMIFMGKRIPLHIIPDKNTLRGLAVVTLEGLSHQVTAGTALQAYMEYEEHPVRVCRGGGRNQPQCYTTAHRKSSLYGEATLTLVNHQPVREPVPAIVWREFCPFDRTGGVLMKTGCAEPGGNKTVLINGRSWTAASDCWRYVDSYQVPVISDGSCAEYVKNPACTLALRQCAYKQDGVCLHENATWSCEQRTTGTGQLCGGKFFCTDGSCTSHEAGKNNSFARAVSQLAAVAAAGKDVAAMNDPGVRVFTGRAQFCKKTGAGFNNCCKDTGWGNDFGLASCSSEEKALGQAKQRRLTVDVGEYCSKKVLGVCMEKKRGYCTFDSKLAQIVQQQGRQWQLGIGFGEAKSPDCAGISVAQLQQIKFDQLDFTSFISELQNGMALPAESALLERASQQIQHHLSTPRGGQ